MNSEMNGQKNLLKRRRKDVSNMPTKKPKAVKAELPVMTYEGRWSRIYCESCCEIFYIEDDCQNGDIVTCDACNEEGTVDRA